MSRHLKFCLTHFFIFIMQIKGKQIKDYIIGETLLNYKDMTLLSGHTTQGQDICILMIDKKNLQHQHFVAYNNLLLENKARIHPRYIEPIQSSNNIYLVIEKISKLNFASIDYRTILPSLIAFYHSVGEFKVEEQELFVTVDSRIVYLPFYKRINTSSKFYAQFHNKSVLAQLFCKMLPTFNKNRAFEIFIQNIDNPKAEEVITKLVQQQNIPSPSYPSLDSTTFDEEKQDQEILQLMSEAKVNSDMKKQAGDLFKRQSVRRIEQDQDKQMNNIMENVKSSIASRIKVNKSQQQKTKIEVRLNKSKVEGNQFEVYFKSYCQSLRFIKKSIKKLLQYYKTGFAGIVSSYLLVTILSLRKAYMIKDLEIGIDIFQLGISMKSINIHKYVAVLGKQLKSEARMGVQLRGLIQNCKMPMKTFNILAQFLEQDISMIDFDLLQNFTFFFLSALLKSKQYGKEHHLYMIETMYILLHKNYEIVFFESDFPTGWSQKYFDQKVTLIEAILPNWSLK